MLQTLKDRGIYPLAYRYYLLQVHYRSPITFSWSALEAAQTAYYKLLYTFASASPSSSVVPAEVGIQSVFDDLGTAEVIASVWKLAKEKNRKAILEADAVLGLDIENQSRKLAEEMNAVPDSIKKLASAREDARRQKDFKKSDELREQIQEEGFDVMDTDSGSILRKKL